LWKVDARNEPPTLNRIHAVGQASRLSPSLKNALLSGRGKVRKPLIPNLKFKVRDRRDACPTPVAALMAAVFTAWIRFKKITAGALLGATHQR
jgi:hypothetical protein